MIIRGKMYIDDKGYTLRNFTFGYQQATDPNGRPCTDVYCKTFHVEIESPGNFDLLGWANSDLKMKHVKIILSPHTLTKPRTIELYDTLCIGYDEDFYHRGPIPMTTRLELSAGIMVENGEVMFERSWRKTDLNQAKTKPVLKTTEPPKVLDLWFEDENGERLKMLKKDKNIQLAIQSQEMVGKTVKIDLSDDKIDYEYQGNYVEDDLLENIKITSNNMRINLKTLKQRK